MLRQGLDHHSWATEQLLDRCTALTDEQLTRHLAHRLEHALIDDVAPAQLLVDHAAAVMRPAHTKGP